jgi:hypothetical protein
MHFSVNDLPGISVFIPELPVINFERKQSAVYPLISKKFSKKSPRAPPFIS